MGNKQTAVEWIESKLNSVKPTDFCSLQDVKDWVKEAKQMEKEQEQLAKKESYNEGWLEATQYILKKYKEQEDGNL